MFGGASSLFSDKKPSLTDERKSIISFVFVMTLFPSQPVTHIVLLFLRGKIRNLTPVKCNMAPLSVFTVAAVRNCRGTDFLLQQTNNQSRFGQ